MKKILFILLSMMFCTSINAVEIKYSDWSSEYPDGINSIKIETEKRYLWYRENEVNVEYRLYKDIEDRKVDMLDTEYSEYSEFSLKEPEIKMHQEIISELRTKVLPEDEITDIVFTDINVRNQYKIYEIEIFFDGIKQNYITNFNMINDNGFDESVDILGAIKVAMKLNGSFDPNDMSIKITYSYSGIGIGTFKINLGIEQNDNLYYTYYKSITPNICSSKCTQVIEFDTSYVKDNRIMQMYYAYRDILYKTYEIEKEYADGYYDKYDGYIKDSSTEKEYYRYILNDHIIKDNEGNIIEDNSDYCDKHVCLMVYLPYEENEIPADTSKINSDISTFKIIEEPNPKTIDHIIIYIIIFSVSLLVISITIMKYVEKKHMKK